MQRLRRLAVHCNAPVGVFDSGLGGLSVLAEIRRLLPQESLLYVADSAYVPYGEKTQEQIIERSLLLSGFLLDQGAKALVVACNTATAAAIQPLRERWPSLNVIGMEPAVKPAAAQSRSGKIGVLATTGTLNSKPKSTKSPSAIRMSWTRLTMPPMAKLAVKRNIT